MSATIKEYNDSHLDAIRDIAQALPEWFTGKGVEKLSIDIGFQKGYVALIGSTMVGFVTFFVQEGIAHIGWMGVMKEHQRKGIWMGLLNGLEEMLKKEGIKELRVDTLGDSVEYEPYERTRAFYRKVGFTKFKSVMQDDPECPEKLTMHKMLD